MHYEDLLQPEHVQYSYSVNKKLSRIQSVYLKRVNFKKRVGEFKNLLSFSCPVLNTDFPSEKYSCHKT